MTWLDALLALLVVSVAALGYERRWSGAIIALCGVLLVGPLLRLGLDSAITALLAGLIVGLLLAVLSLRFIRDTARSPAGAVAGGLAGLLLAGTLLVSILISLPIGRTPDGSIVYPAQTLPGSVQAAANRSPLVAYGRSVLLQPLLAAQPNSDAASQMGVTRWLHEWLVPSEPWLSE